MYIALKKPIEDLIQIFKIRNFNTYTLPDQIQTYKLSLAKVTS